MKPALLLIDLQHDFLAARSLQPAAPQIIARAAELLAACRTAKIPVLHVVTTVQRQPDNRMPHWKSAALSEGKWICEAGTPGHSTPPELAPLADEPIVHKQFFSGFRNADLDAHLRASGCDTLLLAGVHLHGCVRATAFDAYERGYEVWVAADAVGSDDPIHAAITRRYLEDRCTRFVPNSALLKILIRELPSYEPFAVQRIWQHRSPAKTAANLWEINISNREDVSNASAALSRAWKLRPVTSLIERADALRRLAAALSEHETEFAREIATDVGKPIRMAHGEVRRSVELLHAVADQAAMPLEAASGPHARWRRMPLGVVALITPWNNPLAIPVGKIAPALLYDNAVLWKPALPGSRIAQRLAALWQAASGNLLTLVTGDHHTAGLLADNPDVDAVSLSGSLQAGYALQERCARRHIPFQAELGGNNAAIIADDANLASAAPQIVAGAFGFAGQRCTANRRVIVAAARIDETLAALTSAARNLVWGDPLDETTAIGPLINREKRDEVLAAVKRAKNSGLQVLIPHADQSNYAALIEHGAYCPPAIIVCPDPSHEYVQEEFFAPLLVVQPADSFDHALALCNGVRQGLVAALFSNSPTYQKRFLAEIRAGVLKLNSTTADADATSPLGGWKASGIGPAEHGPSDREFFTRIQTLYES